MITLIHYLIEANISLLLFLVFYILLLRKETNFTFLRAFIIGGIIVSLLIPIVDINAVQPTFSIPSVRQVLPTYLLPEVTVTGKDAAAINDENVFLTVWSYLQIVYWLGVLFSSSLFIYQIRKLVSLLGKGKAYLYKNNIKIIELSENIATFSFFNHIVIGNASQLSITEKQMIIRHEYIHASQWHSFDILLVSVLRIFFWFNPLLRQYKTIFVQLHEFEADARAVENQDVNMYCNLIARVALQSAGLPLGNHFNNSLTIKRIQMMKTVKSKIKSWKIAMSIAMIPMALLVITSQAQIDKQNEQDIPLEARKRFETFKIQHPGRTFLVEYGDAGSQTLAALQQKYGQADFTEPITVKDKNGNGRMFSMLQYIKHNTTQDTTVFTVVEEVPEYQGGFEAMMDKIKENLQYPKEARKNKIDGTTYISFIVEIDGTLSEVRIVKGFDATCDAEAERVVKLLNTWIPGKQNGEPVRVRFVLPIKFKLG
jgi:TonB family protein